MNHLHLTFRSPLLTITYSVCMALLMASCSAKSGASVQDTVGAFTKTTSANYPSYSPQLNKLLPPPYVQQQFSVQLKVHPDRQEELEKTLMQLGIIIQSKIDQDWMLIANTSQLIHPDLYQHPAIAYVDIQPPINVPSHPVIRGNDAHENIRDSRTQSLTHINIPMALAMLAQTQQADAGRQNITFSPYGIGQVGLAALMGSAHPDQLKRPEWFFGAINHPEQLQTLALPTAPISLAVYNDLWYGKQHQLQPYFQTRYQQLAGSVHSLDLGNTNEAANTINQKIAQQTQSKITQLLSASDLAKAEAVLTNAVHFKAKWQQPFEEFRTRPIPFVNADQSSVTVPMMSAKQRLDYAKVEGFQWVRLPFSDRSTVLTLILPPADQPLAIPTQAQWDALEEKSAAREIVINLPKLQLQGEKIDLQTWLPDLKNWELDQLLQEQVLSNLTGIHQATIEWDETGAEAAAATALISKRSLEVIDQISFNRPFSFVLQDTQQVLFVGAVRQLPNTVPSPTAVEPMAAQVRSEPVLPVATHPVQGLPQVIVDQIKP